METPEKYAVIITSMIRAVHQIYFIAIWISERNDTEKQEIVDYIEKSKAKDDSLCKNVKIKIMRRHAYERRT